MYKKGDFKFYIIITVITIFSIIMYSSNNITGNTISKSSEDLFVSDFGININNNIPNSFIGNKLTAKICSDGKYGVSSYDVKFIINDRQYDEYKRTSIGPKECVYSSVLFKPFMENMRYVEASVIVDPLNKIIESDENNNKKYSILNLSSYSPNLVITSIDVVGSRINVKFCNRSPKTYVKKQFDITIALDNIKRNVHYPSYLNPGACADIFSPYFNDYGIDKKELFVEATIDKANTIVESDENDNYLSKRISI